MPTEFPLSLNFKGSRTYLQGPDIHDAVCDLLAAEGYSAICKVDLIFRKLAETQLKATVYLDEAIPESSANAVFRCTFKDNQVTVFLNETGDEVLGRVSYDEESMIEKATLDAGQRTISVEPQAGFSNIETVVSLNKTLLRALFPEATGRWIFTRLQLPSSIRHTTWRRLEVRFLDHSNFRITRSKLFGDGVPLGTLYFSLLPSP